ncbi:MAG: dTDP-4-dehydrorhamnose 3,5-epimerase [Anaerolineae bacterium]|nr:dTDP-4-dehydrorhamnose 3,5-epimerase [Anaerolineae bacterium]
MKFQVISTHLGEVKVVGHEAFDDHRGFFMESYHRDHFRALGLPSDFVQLNHSGSVKGVLRGLHFQWDPPMGKLMRVVRGEAFIVAVDIRKGSPTVGQWYGEILSEKNRLQMWAPASFARGFCVVSDFAEIEYLCTGNYNGAAESGVLWNDPAIGIEWPVSDPILSARDASAQTLAQWLARPEADYFSYAP